jgi:hypothetical protein
MAMGAVLGIAAFGRTQEKLAGASTNGTAAGTTYVPPSGVAASPAPYTPAPVASTPEAAPVVIVQDTTNVTNTDTTRATPRRKIE